MYIYAQYLYSINNIIIYDRNEKNKDTARRK